MPLENLFADNLQIGKFSSRIQAMYEKFAVISNPFPSAGQTSGHPHKETSADQYIDSKVQGFYENRKSVVISVTASQGIGKTNLLNAYEVALREKLAPKGFFVIRYIADPEPSFDPLIRSLFENLGSDHLQNLARAFSKAHPSKEDRKVRLEQLQVLDVRNLMDSLSNATNNEQSLTELSFLGHQWLLGLPIRKAHRERLGVQFRLDTVESKTRVLRDLVFFSAEMKILEGIFLLLDELEKQGSTQSTTNTVKYLSALRALIDALPKYLFLITAITPDALDRYQEMLPALRGRLANRVPLNPLTSEQDALGIWSFYIKSAAEEAKSEAEKSWSAGKELIVNRDDAAKLFSDMKARSRSSEVKQRDYLNELHSKAQREIDLIP
jgi:hypothetical protein